MGQSSRRIARSFLISLAIAFAPGSLLAQTQDGSPRPGWSSGLFLDGLVESAPAIGPDGTIYVAAYTDKNPSRGQVWAIRPDGTRKWLPHLPGGYFEAEGDIFGSPALSNDGRTLYFGAWDGRFYALDTATGRKKWHFTIDVDVPTIIVNASPAIASDGTIYFGSSDVDVTRPGSLHALVDEETQARSISTRRVSGAVETTPAIGPDGTIYFGALDPSISSPAEQTIAGRLYAVRPDDLSDKWPSIRVAGQVFSSPAIARDGTIYFGDYVEGLHAVSPTGEKKWSYPTGSIHAGPTLGADGTIYVGSIQNWQFYAINPNGTEKWTENFGEAAHIYSTAAVRADGSIVFAVNLQGNRSRVYAFDAERKKLWEQNRNGLIYSSPAIAPDGTIYIGANDRRLHSFHGSGSPISLVSSWPMFGRDITHTSRATPPTDTRLLNLSTRGLVGGDANLIGGFAVRGTATKRYLIRGIGPTLTAFGVANPLPNPTVSVHAPGTAPLAFNDDWVEPPPPGPSLIQVMSSVGAFALPQGSRDAVVLPSLAPGLYTAVIGAADGGTGTALVEVYDPTPDDPNAALINLSTRGRVGPELVIAGFVIRGTRPLRVLVRAVGPGLVPFGVTGVLARPALAVFSGQQQGQQQIDANTSWSTSPLRADIAAAAALSGAFPLSSADSATVLTLTPQNSLADFTIQVSGAGGATGTVLAEIYAIP